jgi:ribosomal protein L22
MEVELGVGCLEQGLAAADDDRVDVEAVLVDQVVRGAGGVLRKREGRRCGRRTRYDLGDG